MYSVLIKADAGYETWSNENSLASAECEAMNLVIGLVGYLEGYGHKSDVFLKSHPTSTFNTPEYYCIKENDTYKIYQHYKNCYWLSSEHVYSKKYSVKIIRTRQLVDHMDYLITDYYGYFKNPSERVERIRAMFTAVVMEIHGVEEIVSEQPTEQTTRRMNRPVNKENENTDNEEEKKTMTVKFKVAN